MRINHFTSEMKERRLIYDVEGGENKDRTNDLREFALEPESKSVDEKAETAKRLDAANIEAAKLPMTEQSKQATSGMTEKANAARSAAEKFPEEQKFAKTKDVEMQKREGEKFKEAPEDWGTIPHGITDSKGEPYVYKQDSMQIGDKQANVVVAYSPTGQLQYMVEGTGEWKRANDPKYPDGQALVNKYDKMKDDYPKKINAERSKDSTAYDKSVDQKKRNAGAEDFLKDKTKGKTEFKYADGHWEGNENIRNSLNGGKAKESAGDAAGAKLTGKEADKAPSKDDTEGSGEARPITTEERAKAKETERKNAEKNESGSGEERPISAEERAKAKEIEKQNADKKEPEKTETGADKKEKNAKAKEIADAEKTLNDKNATEGDKELARQTLLRAELDKLDAQKNGKKEKEEEKTEETKKAPEADKKAPKGSETLEKIDSEKEQRSRLMGEVRNAKPMKTVEQAINDKKTEFDKDDQKTMGVIDRAETDVRVKKAEIGILKGKINTLEAETDPKKKEENAKKIAKMKVDLSVDEEVLEGYEKTYKNKVKEQENKRDAMISDQTMLERMASETKTLALRTQQKIRDMGKELQDSEENLGKMAKEGISVTHDDSLGLKVELSANLKKMLQEDKRIPDALLNFSAENPVPLLRALQALLENAKKREATDKKKKVA